MQYAVNSSEFSAPVIPRYRDRVNGGTGLDRGGHNIFCLPRHFVIKSNVVVQISCYVTVGNVSPAQNQGINEKTEHHHWIICRHNIQIS